VVFGSKQPKPKLGFRMTICACIIAKNEAHCIERCLNSIKGFADRVLVSDTGSSDATVEVVKAWLSRNGVQGGTINAPWRDFAFNRNEVIGLARTAGMDYALVIDADDTLEWTERPDFQHQCYDFKIQHGGVTHYRPHLFSLALPFRYCGVIHEFLDCREPFTRMPSSCAIRIGNDSSRRGDHERFVNDAKLLRIALIQNEEPALTPRYSFYLAQSYRDSGSNGEALKEYVRRASLGGYVEEIFYSWYQAGILAERLRRPLGECLEYLCRAMQICPLRAEPYFAAARFLNLAGLFHGAWPYAQAIFLEEPKGLFVESWIYEYGMWDEYAVSAIRTGRKEEGADACRRVLASKNLPPNQRDRVEKNLALCQ
jgi:glycosyltransferase involved in cell wall biosynthesis